MTRENDDVPHERILEDNKTLHPPYDHPLSRWNSMENIKPKAQSGSHDWTLRMDTAFSGKEWGQIKTAF